VGWFTTRQAVGQVMDLRSSWARQLVMPPWVALSLRVPDSRHGLDVGNASTLPEESGSQRANYPSTQNIPAASNSVVSNELISAPRESDATGAAASGRDPKAGEGERRLAYVGITRAERRLYLTRALARTCDSTRPGGPRRWT
jgi:hypothetical protein